MEPARVRSGTPSLDFSGYYASAALSDCTITITTLRNGDADQASTPSAKRQKAQPGAGTGVWI